MHKYVRTARVTVSERETGSIGFGDRSGMVRHGRLVRQRLATRDAWPSFPDSGRFGRNHLRQHIERRLPLATPRALTTHLVQLAVAMLRPTLIRAAHVHKPLIRFPDRRAPKST